METIEVYLERTGLDKKDAVGYVNVLNGIAYECANHNAYSQGNRNTIAVDLTVACYMLELDSYEILELFEKHGLIDDANDDECAEKRMTRVMDYYYKFSWGWMIDPEEFAKVGILHPTNDELAFVLVD